MSTLVVTFVVALVASAGLTRVVRSVARRWGIVDRPDGKRKLHAGPVPSWGGVAVYAAFVLGLLVANYGSAGAGGAQIELSTTLILTAGIVCLFGGIDDCWDLNSRLKLLLQVCAVLPIVALGYYIDRIVAFGYPIELGWFGIPLTVAWLVGCINALNLLDGMDGLASTIGFLTAAMIVIIATSMGNPHVAVIAIALAGALAGFLIYNLPSASIFLGDSGSMVIGLILGVLAIQGAVKTSATLAITVPAVIMSLPMFDMVLALVRRKLTGKRFDTADRQHVHHRLMDRGLSQWQALCIIGALCLATGAAATAATILRTELLAWITALALIVLAIRLRVFGDHELALAKSAVRRGLANLAHRLGTPGPRRTPSDVRRLARLPFEAAWRILIDEMKAWKVRRVELIISCRGEPLRRHAWSDPAAQVDQERGWSIATALNDRDHKVCEIRATGAGAMDSELLYSSGLAGVLMVFGTHFTNHFEQIPGRIPLDEKQIRPDQEYEQRSKAA